MKFFFAVADNKNKIDEHFRFLRTLTLTANYSIWGSTGDRRADGHVMVISLTILDYCMARLHDWIM